MTSRIIKIVREPVLILRSHVSPLKLASSPSKVVSATISLVTCIELDIAIVHTKLEMLQVALSRISKHLTISRLVSQVYELKLQPFRLNYMSRP